MARRGRKRSGRRKTPSGVFRRTFYVRSNRSTPAGPVSFAGEINANPDLDQFLAVAQGFREYRIVKATATFRHIQNGISSAIPGAFEEALGLNGDICVNYLDEYDRALSTDFEGALHRNGARSSGPAGFRRTWKPRSILVRQHYDPNLNLPVTADSLKSDMWIAFNPGTGDGSRSSPIAHSGIGFIVPVMSEFAGDQPTLSVFSNYVQTVATTVEFRKRVSDISS